MKTNNSSSESPTKKEKEEKPKLTQKQKIKIGVFSGLNVLAGFLSWYSLSRILENGLRLEAGHVAASLITLLFPVLSFCAWIALVGLLAALFPIRKILYSVLFVSILPLFLFFSFNFYTLIVLLILSLSFFYFSHGVRKEKNDRVSFHINKVIKIHLGLTLIFCVAGVSLIFYSQLVEKERRSEMKTSEAVAGMAGNLVNVILESQLENYNPDLTLDEFILSAGQDFMEKIGPQLGEEVGVKESFTQDSLVAQLEEAINSGQVKKEDLPPEVLSKLEDGKLNVQDVVEANIAGLFNEQLTQARDDFLSQLGVEAKGSDKISEVIKKIISTKLSEGLSSYDHLLPPFLAISLFFSLAIFLFLYKIFTNLIALLVYMILLLSNVVVIQKKQGEIETAEFS